MQTISTVSIFTAAHKSTLKVRFVFYVPRIFNFQNGPNSLDFGKKMVAIFL
jgi:hypothetical protein